MEPYFFVIWMGAMLAAGVGVCWLSDKLPWLKYAVGIPALGAAYYMMYFGG